jgi:hypothetical protein
MGVKVGKKKKVTRGSDKVLGMGTWKFTPPTMEELDSTEFDQEHESFTDGIWKDGNFSFDGWLRPDDETGQESMRKAHIDREDVTDLRFYVDATSYYEPCQTTGYFSPTYTTGAPTFLSHAKISSYDVNADKSGLGRLSFSGRMHGWMVLV